MSGPSRTVSLGGGLATTLGAGVLAGLAPAASVAGVWLFAGLVIAAAIATVVSIVDIPRRLGPTGAAVAHCGRLAGGAAVAGMFGTYVLPESPALGAVALAVVVAVVVAAIQLTGVGLPPWLLPAGAVVVLATFAMVVLACVAIDPVAPAVAPPPDTEGADDPLGILAATVICYPAFLARRRDDRAVIGIALVVYLAVAAAVWHQLGGPRLALSPAPLRAALDAADATAITPLLTIGVAVAGVLVLGGLLGEITSEIAAVPARRPVVLVLGTAVVALAAVVLTPAVALAAAGALMLLAAVLGHGR